MGSGGGEIYRVRTRLSWRDAKVEKMKLLMYLLASKGYATKDDIGILSDDTFKFYCLSVGGVVVKYHKLYCKRSDFELKPLGRP